jgi:hypothetical protein
MSLTRTGEAPVWKLASNSSASAGDPTIPEFLLSRLSNNTSARADADRAVAPIAAPKTHARALLNGNIKPP